MTRKQFIARLLVLRGRCTETARGQCTRAAGITVPEYPEEWVIDSSTPSGHVWGRIDARLYLYREQHAAQSHYVGRVGATYYNSYEDMFAGLLQAIEAKQRYWALLDSPSTSS